MKPQIPTQKKAMPKGLRSQPAMPAKKFRPPMKGAC